MILYVDANAFRDGNGSREMPYKHINAAAQAAKPGDEVLVAPGIYREYVDFQNGDSLSMPTSKGKIPMKRKWRSMCAATALCLLRQVSGILPSPDFV